ncbi:DUF4189 domain-containing protein [Luteimonas sp. e5]
MLVKRVILPFVFLVGLALPGFGSAQAPPTTGPCPPGAVPSQGVCVSPAQAAANRAGSSRPSIRETYTEVWENRFGAIAADYENSRSGVSENQRSKRAAERLALSQCGTRGCRVISSIRNSCHAVAYGPGGVGHASYENQETAERFAIEQCNKVGRNCEVQYSSCSLPVRVK